MQAQALETPDDYHDLIVHLLHSGGALWIPGAKPHARNQAVMFEPDDLPDDLDEDGRGGQLAPSSVETSASPSR